MTLLRSALLATALALPASPLLARDMTPQDVARIEYTGTVAVSQDGSSVAYTRVHYPDVTIGEENGSADQQLFLADGALDTRAYLPEDMSVSSIGFTPDGSMITFLWTDEDDDRALWGIPVNGGAYRKIAGVEDSSVSDYAFSPDGSQVYLLASAAPDTERDDEAEDGFNAVVYEEEFRFNRMFVANVGGTEIDPEPVEIDVPGYVSSFDLAPNGQTAMIVTAPTPLVDDSLTSQRVNLLDLASGALTVVETPGKLGDVEFSPDSTQLSMVAGVDENDPAATTLHLVDVSTGAYRALNEGAAEAVMDTEWMADGRLAAVVHVGVQSVLRFYSDQGTEMQEYDPGALILTSLEQGGNRLMVEANSPTHPNELFAFNGGEFTRWTDLNPWLTEIDFGEQRAYTYTATDGQQIEGVLVLPVDGVPAGGAPTIFDVHGGPEAHESNGWVTAYGGPGQVAAGAGYAVFLPNYRGSTAYGTAFSKAHSGNYTDPEFRDLVDAKYALVADGIADADRVGITGGSYGGYATAWSSTYNSEEFAAGVMFVGISNQISKVGTGDIPNEMYLVHALQWPWEDWQHFLEVSPIYYTDRADTPLLIMGGTADTRVDPGQSLELYRYIRLRRPDTPLRLVRYPGEGHGNSMAAARYDYNLRMMRWFDTYLMTGDRDAELPPSRPDLMIEED
ncbi:S9 family peptidase [Aurantiacibacter hainanensis]|uniref:S9 family peptidase n=1 Tax=Aurantiacibacter hainanensis TaxID=3076114 RepID=UPI0030C704B4